MTQYAALIRLLACLGAAIALFVGGCHYGKVGEQNSQYQANESRQAVLDKKLEEERARSEKLNEELRELLSQPKAGVTVREIVRSNPSNCTRPVAVTDSLQSAIGRSNQAIAASRSNGAVQRDPGSNRK